MKSIKTSHLYLSFTILCWGATPTVAKLALSELTNFQLLFWTSWAGLISLFVIICFQKKMELLKKYAPTDYLKMAGMGGLGIYLYYVLLFGSFDLVPAGQANVVNYLWPIFIILFSIPILKESYNWKTFLAIFVSFFGAFLVFTEGQLIQFSPEYMTGYVLAFLAAICYGLFSVLGKKLTYEKFTGMTIYYFFATLFISVTTFYKGNFIIPTSFLTIASVLLLGVISSSIAFVFWFKALAIGDTHKTANFIYAVPFLALLFTWYFNDEVLTWYALLGLIFVVGGILIQLKNKAPNTSKPPPLQ